MPRKIQLKPTGGYVWRILGIASDSAIWKLCYDLNEALGLSLKAQELSPGAEGPDVKEGLPSLFLETAFRQQDEPKACYEDNESWRPTEFVLVQPRRASLPTDVRGFGFFLVIRTPDTGDDVVQKVLQGISKLDILRSVVDLSHQKNLKNTLL